MARTVPVRLRNRALRKLWISNPVLANLDELIDYGDDYTNAAAVLENIQTAYQVGRGFVDKVADLPDDEAEVPEEKVAEAQEPAEAVADGSDGEDSVDEDGVDEGGADDVAGPDLAGEPGVDAENEAAAVVAEQPAPAPRMPMRQRMRFRVAEE